MGNILFCLCTGHLSAFHCHLRSLLCGQGSQGSWIHLCRNNGFSQENSIWLGFSKAFRNRDLDEEFCGHFLLQHDFWQALSSRLNETQSVEFETNFCKSIKDGPRVQQRKWTCPWPRSLQWHRPEQATVSPPTIERGRSMMPPIIEINVVSNDWDLQSSPDQGASTTWQFVCSKCVCCQFVCFHLHWFEGPVLAILMPRNLAAVGILLCSRQLAEQPWKGFFLCYTYFTDVTCWKKS